MIYCYLHERPWTFCNVRTLIAGISDYRLHVTVGDRLRYITQVIIRMRFIWQTRLKCHLVSVKFSI